MDTVVVRWDGERRFVGRDEAGHAVVMDPPKESGGGGSGVRPLELALCALGGCTGIDVISILSKQRQEVREFEVRVTASQREEQPRIYTEVAVEYVVTGRDVNPAFVERAVALSEEKYCSVRGMFGPQVGLTSSWRIVEAE